MGSCPFQGTIDRVRNVNRGSHLHILPYLWLNRKVILSKKNAESISLSASYSEVIVRYLLPPLVAAAVPIAIGRFNSSVSCVPAGRVADRCLLSQCTVVEPAPTAPPISTPGPPPISPPINMPPAVPPPTSS